jgi:hypothetical protein
MAKGVVLATATLIAIALPAGAKEKTPEQQRQATLFEYQLRTSERCEQSLQAAKNPGASPQVQRCFELWISDWCGLRAEISVAENTDQLTRIRTQHEMVDAAYRVCVDHATRTPPTPKEPGLWARLFGE